MQIVFLAPYAKFITPTQRFRFEHYLPFLYERKLKYSYVTFVTEKDSKTLLLHGKNIQKLIIILIGIIKRLFLFLTIFKYDFVYIHREIIPIGPPIFEWFLAKVLKKKIIYDFDDAIWLSISSEANPKIAKIKCTWKVSKICSYSHIVTVGNEYLGVYAKQFCNDVRVIPTVVDTEFYHNKVKNQNEKPLTIGWTGSFTTLKYLNSVIPVIEKLKQRYEFDFLIIANKDPKFTTIDYNYLEWDSDSEIKDLLKMNIGIMPLLDTAIELGKCGFKAIQYMSLGIPAVVSPIGANVKIVIDNENGFLATDFDEWYEKLEILLSSLELRNALGDSARNYIINNYSITSTKSMFLDLFKNKN